MRQALTLARRYTGRTAPNPAVGCVIVKNETIVGKGAHRAAGEPHAEINALAVAGRAATGATMYVTLEPCSHHGRTPPCADAVIASGLTRVVIGTKDPNPTVSGRGIRKLKSAGIRVETGTCEQDARDLIADFAVWIKHDRPYVIQKTASTWDGATASSRTGREQLTGQASQRFVHRWRSRVDAVLVGGETWRRDNPDLRPRASRSATKPWRVVAIGELPAPSGTLAEVEPLQSWWICALASPSRRQAWEDLGSRVTVCGGKRPSPGRILKELYNGGVHRVLLEGGATLAHQFVQRQLVDWLVIGHGPQLAAGTPGVPVYSGKPVRPLKGNVRFVPRSVRRFDDDIWAHGPVEYLTD